jgi:hydroxypyruvate isomerase
MLRFDANLTTMYSKLPLLEAMAAAQADGFEAIECRSPFSEPKEKVADALADLGLKLVQFNCPMGDFSAGERGIACLPGREGDFRASIALTIEYAQALGCGQVNCIAGLTPAGANYDHIEAVLVENLKYAAPRLADAGVKLQIEAVNPLDNPGTFLTTTDQFERIYDRVGSDNLYLQYDFYHMQVVQGDLVRTYERLKDRINHVQVADNPGRHEPGTGEINYPFIFSELDRLGYTGWVGCEYVPAKTAAAGLGWLSQYRLSCSTTN